VAARTERVVFRVTAEERAELRRRASGDGEGAYIRARLFGDAPPATTQDAVTHPGVWLAQYAVDGIARTELVLAFYARDGQLWLRGTDDDYEEPARVAEFLDAADQRRVAWTIVHGWPDGGNDVADHK